MAEGLKFKGLNTVLRNLNKEIMKLDGATRDGILDALLYVKREASYKVPVKTGNLRASAYVVTQDKPVNNSSPRFKGKGGGRLGADHRRIIEQAKARVGAKRYWPTGEIGYTAYYAIFVHEIDKNYRRPGSSWKYLEIAFNENRREILKILKQHMKIKYL